MPTQFIQNASGQQKEIKDFRCKLGGGDEKCGRDLGENA